MKQAVMTEPGKIKFYDVETPEIKSSQALIRIHRIGICGSDVHVYHGRHPFTDYPIVQGHEVSGEIVKIGKDVKLIKPGDRVIVRPQIVCGYCRQCIDGNYNICENLKVLGFQIDGAGGEYYAADEECIIKIPDGMSHDGGALVEPLAVGTHAIERAGGVSDLNVLVIGAGPIGNLTAQAAKAKGARSVLISDKSEFRLKLASECNIDFLHNAELEDLGAKLSEYFGNDKADLIFDCVGSEASLRASILNARKGTKIVTVGVYEGEIKADISKIQDRELKLIGTLMYKEEDMIEAVKMIATGQIDYRKIITRSFPFNNYLEAYQHLERNADTEMKIIIDLAGKS